jgi:two-component system response regulator
LISNYSFNEKSGDPEMQSVLIIDDNENDVLITKRALSQFGREIRTETASNGEEGLALLQGGNAPPDLILLDLKMPGMDGIEVLRRIRCDDHLKHIPVAVVTHSSLESDVTASCVAGANAVIHKAFDLERFRKEIADTLESLLSI